LRGKEKGLLNTNTGCSKKARLKEIEHPKKNRAHEKPFNPEGGAGTPEGESSGNWDAKGNPAEPI